MTQKFIIILMPTGNETVIPLLVFALCRRHSLAYTSMAASEGGRNHVIFFNLAQLCSFVLRVCASAEETLIQVIGVWERSIRRSDATTFFSMGPTQL